MEEIPNELKTGRDGRVTRLFRCECGTPVYRKDLTNNRFEIMFKDRGQFMVTQIKTGPYCEMKCPNPSCKLTHKILSTAEEIKLVDEIDTEGVQ